MKSSQKDHIPSICGESDAVPPTFRGTLANMAAMFYLLETCSAILWTGGLGTDNAENKTAHFKSQKWQTGTSTMVEQFLK